MNINESCLLNFLLNPEEIIVMTEIFRKNIEEIENNSINSGSINSKTA